MAPQDTRSEVNCGRSDRGTRSRRAAPAPPVEEQAARPAQSLVDREAAVEPRVVDQSLPAHRRPRLLEVHPHHDAQVARQVVGQGLETPPVLEPGHRIVDGAGTHDDHEPVVGAAERGRDLLAPSGDGDGPPLAERQLLEEDGRRHQGPKILYAKISSPFHAV
jgi:hypothetical protein